VEDFHEADSVYMTNLIQEMEFSYTNDNYPKVIDVTSFARFCLVHDIMGTHHYGANRYYIKQDKSDTTLVEMPLLWDFDREDGNPVGWSLTHKTFFSHFFENQNRTFVNEYAKLWNQLRPDLYYHIDNFFRSAYITEGYAIANSMYLDDRRWNKYHPVYDSFLNRPKWIEKRIPWLDSEINKLVQP
jgi:hypothetical protein